MFELKPIAPESVSRAIAKAERYRLLNEPREAESICRDVLDADPGNQDALIALVLAQSDRFGSPKASADEARQLVSRLKGAFERSYYGGVVEERWAKALFDSGYPGETVFGLLREAMTLFEAADKIANTGNDDAVLRWNACVRFIQREGLVAAQAADAADEESLDDDVPVR
ncbi:MAG: hypothetical protein KF805_13080 [Phycisphaeraceae bacterium]|nr:hypothetical protein [Phycisphaeraceae bacterium]